MIKIEVRDTRDPERYTVVHGEDLNEALVKVTEFHEYCDLCRKHGYSPDDPWYFQDNKDIAIKQIV